jgi:hypothetical protein
MATEISQKKSKLFYCEVCDTTCFKPNEWKRHINTKKHLSNINGENVNPIYSCNCGKIYKDRSGLWRHSKKCQYIFECNEKMEVDNKKTELSLDVLINDNQLFKEFIIEVVKNNTELQKQNQELQKKMMDMCSINNSTISNHSHNKTFNMQFFLNEQCKDAMNIMDFVDTFKLEFADLEKVGEVGYVEGISNIIIKKLNEMDIYKRPIHCSDAKRETMFVKDKNVWEKETGNYNRLRLAIRHISKKNTDLLISWCDAHPGACESDNYLNDVYIEMVRQAMGGRDLEENENKIIRKIARTCLIDKGI